MLPSPRSAVDDTGVSTPPESGCAWTLVRDEEQELATTVSRRSGPRRWLRSVTWLVSAGLHPRANATTLRVAEDLAARMDYDLGHVLYGLDRMAARLRISRATATRHVRYLRELGALVFVAHGSQRNSRAARGLDGYAATATTYAAAIPPVYDRAMGHQLVGEGYDARIVVDQRDRRPVDNPVDTPGAESVREPLSLTGVKVVGKMKMVGGGTTTGKPVADTSTTPAKTPSKRRDKKRSTILGAAVTAAGAQLADRLARTLRSTVPWLRRASHDQVRWVCADMGERGWTLQQAFQFASDAAIVHRGAGILWQPRRPHTLLATHLRNREQQHLAEQLRASGRSNEKMDNAAWEAVCGTTPTAPAADKKPEGGYTDEDRRTARAYGWGDFARVAEHYADDPYDALDLYGEKLCIVADRQARREGNYL
ncbi:hypothetical protein OG422_31470 (plasmid) [Streptomyces sp. NBC_01525]|uniref:hypothetical protein n=1 Tax=Streptomyces sp. NBC_01525 TaxID=2903893 RepID=UPI002F91A898